MSSLSILEYLKKDLLNQKDTDTNQQYLLNLFLNNNIKKRVVSTLFLYVVIFSSGCDYKSPEKWESPSWHIPLTIPLINKIYSFADMIQDSIIVEDTLNNILNITFSEDIVDTDGNRAGIDSSVFEFKIDRLPMDIDIDMSFPETPIVAPQEDISVGDLVPTINLSDMFELDENIECLPVSTLENQINEIDEFPIIIQETITILSNEYFDFSNINLNGENLIEDIHSLVVDDAKFGTMVNNKLPFAIKNYNLEYINYKDGQADTIFAFHRCLGGCADGDEISYNEMESSIIIINPDEPGCSSNPDCKDSQEFGDSLIINLVVEMDFENGTDMCEIFNPETYAFEDKPGWQLDEDLSIHKLDIELYFDIYENSGKYIECTTNNIYTTESVKIKFPQPENIEVRGGKVTSDFIEDVINSMTLTASNSLHANTNIEILFSNFFDDDSVSLVLGDTLFNNDITTKLSESISEYNLGNPIDPDSRLDSIFIEIFVNVNSTSRGLIYFDKEYGIDFSDFVMSEIELAYLTGAAYDIKFDTPSTNIEGIPQLGLGLQFSDVTLVLDIYTQIGLPIWLDMELKGTKAQDYIIAEITPQLNIPPIPLGFSSIGDSVRTVVTINKDGQYVEWYHKGNLEGNEPDEIIFTPVDPENKSIVDVMNFAPEIIELGGGANVIGAGFLAPNSYLWGTFKLIAPLSFVLEQTINVIPSESTPILPMELEKKEHIDTTLVATEIYSNIINNSSLGGELSLLISDSTIFPLFLDSLISGTWAENEIYQYDQYGYKINTSIWDTLREDLAVVIDSISFTAIDTTADTLKALEVQFYRNDTLQFFVGRMFILGFPRSDSIEYHLGIPNLEFPSTNENSVDIDRRKMDWVITDHLRHNVAMITFDSSPTIDTTYVPLTFQTTNYIGVQAYLILTLDSDGLGRELNLINGNEY